MKMGIVVVNGIEANELENVLYKVYRVSASQDINAVISRALNEGCASILAFVESNAQAASIASNQAVHTIVTKCNGSSAGFYVKEAEMFIKARIGLEDICKSLLLSLRNYSAI